VAVKVLHGRRSEDEGARFIRAVAVATGRAEVGGRLPAAALIDRAVQMLAELEGAPGEVPAHIAIDEVTAGLLDGRFEVAEIGAGLFSLQRDQAPGAPVRRLAGKPTTCVGRDIEPARHLPRERARERPHLRARAAGRMRLR
jgi:hypothetical protein